MSAGTFAPEASSTMSPGTSRFAADLLLLAFPHDPRLGNDHLLEGPDAFLGAALLDEPDDRVEHQNGRDDDRVLVFGQGEGHRRGDQQDVDQRACELTKEDHDAADPFCLGQAGWARTTRVLSAAVFSGAPPSPSRVPGGLLQTFSDTRPLPPCISLCVKSVGDTLQGVVHNIAQLPFRRKPQC